MTPRLLAPVAALALVAGCTAADVGASEGTATGSTGRTGVPDATESATTDSGSDTTAAQPEGVIGDPVTLTLEEDESVIAVSPSGEHLVTVTEPTVPEGQSDWSVDVCVRSGEDYQSADCVDGGELAQYPRGAVWNADETLLAYVYPRTNKLNVVCVLDLATGQVRALTDLDARVERPVALTWLADGRIAYSWSDEGATQIRTVDPAVAGSDPQVLVTLEAGQVDQLFTVGDGLLFEGAIDRQRGVFEVTGPGTADVLVPVVAEGAVIATDGAGDLLAFQRWDAHVAMPLTLIDVASGAEHEVGELDVERLVVAAEFSDDDQHLLTLSYAGVRGELQLLDREGEVVATRAFDRVPDSQFSGGVHWSDRGVVVVSRSVGQARHVQVFPVAQPAP